MAVSGEDIGIIKMTAQGDSVTGPLKVKYFRWVAGTTAGHQCTMWDSNGKELWFSDSDGAHFIDIHPMFKIVDGLDVHTLDSGIVYAYIA